MTAKLSPLVPPITRGPGDRQVWGRLFGSAKALAVAQLANRHDGPLLLITEDTIKANQLADELSFYLGPDSVPTLTFPDWETLPYDKFSPYQDIISDRLTALARLPVLSRGILIAPVATLLHRLCPVDYVAANAFVLHVGQRLQREEFRERLVGAGYRCVPQVMEHGDFAVRGSIIDVYPMGNPEPFRLDLFDEDIDTIKTFDVETQRASASADKIHILPAREFPLTPEAIQCFRAQWRKRFEGNPANCNVYKDVSQGLAPAGIEYYLPLFFEHTATLLDYLPAPALIVVDTGVQDAADAFWREATVRHESLRHDVEHPILTPAELFLAANELFAGIKHYPSVVIANVAEEQGRVTHSFASSAPVHLPVDARAPEPLALLKRYLDGYQGRVLIVAESKGRRETLAELFRQRHLPLKSVASWQAFLADDAQCALTVAPLHSGAQLDEPQLAVISETQLFGERVVQKRRRAKANRDPDLIIRNLTELSVGAPVVHEQHGVGRFLGLFTLEAGGIKSEYLALEYADSDRLYVPVASLHLVSRYSGVDLDSAPLHKLGSGQWQKARAKAAQRVHDVAAELLEVYARRAARQGHAFTLDSEAYRAFAQSFPFEETPDQEAAIAAVVADMEAPQPMDRLVCGDVGFGKTEVAMRAAFVAASGGKQVAVLVPTTLLAQQHYQNFKDRFADWPIKIEQVSRFRAKKDMDAVLKGLEDGTVDIVIGTHKLLQPEIKFKRLGLVIIDEEHRFGVRHKEKLKTLRTEVDILTLTATPIPRTLNMALSGTRELSIIATPPAKRLAVKTFVNEWNDQLIREALMREISRGGQVYFLHNEVETIGKIAAELESLAPEARVRIAHGQMSERELEQAMLDFYHRRFNVLVCTTIIESGIDVPTANTILINRADKLGLAQLYQLRGRVGRSHHRAYAYLLIPSRKAMTQDALKRLEAISGLEELGVGFTIATHDLEIRGAGEILGEGQSGHIQEVGFGLYMELLERAVNALKAGRQPELDRPLDHGTEVDLGIPALLPEDYLPDVHTRLIMYKRIASARDAEELQDLQEEAVDRFGPLPESGLNLFRVTGVKLKAMPFGIRKIDMGPANGRLHFDAYSTVDPTAIVGLVQTYPHLYRFEGGDKLRIIKGMPDVDSRLEALDTVFAKFSSNGSQSEQPALRKG